MNTRHATGVSRDETDGHDGPTIVPSSAADLLEPARTPSANPLAAMKKRQQDTGQWTSGQMAGRRWPVACVSLEVTQRCNLDCSLCYLSDHAEAVRDLPLEEILRRIDLIHAHYGSGTDVQVSGGEPTLRRRDELAHIVRALAAKGLRPCLMTNGIRATRDLLTELSQAGLVDVAFHVDSTQQRAGYADETSLNALRIEYLERVRGLPLNVFFNTTVHAANWADVPMLAAFFVRHADQVRFASFQLQADTGRGVLGARESVVTLDGIWQQIESGADCRLNTNVLMAGHGHCNRSAVVLVANGNAHDAFTDIRFVQSFMRQTADLLIDRRSTWHSVISLFQAAVRRPRWFMSSLLWSFRTAVRIRNDLWAARGRVHKLTFFTHNFMDAKALDPQRLEACVFMAMTQHGPMSMCAYNARRDHFLLQPLSTRDGPWQPLRMPAASIHVFPIKLLKGRVRASRHRPTLSRSPDHVAGVPSKIND